jgi:hypothetical protein
MTFLERYNSEETWWRKVLIMEIFHFAMSRQDNTWTIGKTAESFNVSIGLVSENLRIAEASHALLTTILNYDTREAALKVLPKGDRGNAEVSDFSRPRRRPV